jgi:hypothetical protein
MQLSLPQTGQRERGRKKEEREREREREGERENIVALFLFLKGETGALAPFSYLVLKEQLNPIFLRGGGGGDIQLKSCCHELIRGWSQKCFFLLANF